jgi:hypothetical protein
MCRVETTIKGSSMQADRRILKCDERKEMRKEEARI